MRPAPLSACALVLLLASPDRARANGLTTHVWISLKARELVPPGPLNDLVNQPGLQDMLVGGSIFPDGGYAVGDGYGELAHWEPFQLAYLEWIRGNFAPPWSEEATRHIAFLLGMSSHGMADQIFDSLYMERAKVHDASSDWEKVSMDEATDVIMASIFGPQPVPKRWLPTGVLVDLFRSSSGHEVGEQVLSRGQNLTGLAVSLVGMLGKDPQAVEDYQRAYPWATAHMTDESVPGIPLREAEVVAAYWQRVWDRLHGRLSANDVVMATSPKDGATGHARAKGVDSRFSVVFSRRLVAADVRAEMFTIGDSRGTPLPFDLRVFYGNDSHVVHLMPSVDLAEDEEYTVTVLPGTWALERAELAAAHVFKVSTRPPPAAPPAAETGGGEESSCTCVTGTVKTPNASPLALAIPLVAFLIAQRARTRTRRSSPSA